MAITHFESAGATSPNFDLTKMNRKKKEIKRVHYDGIGECFYYMGLKCMHRIERKKKSSAQQL